MFNLFRKDKDKKQLSRFITETFGIKPKKISLYAQAFQHKSILREEKEAHLKSNERLEFLGDAVLDCVVAEFLFHEYPKRDEGFITQLKSRIVNRTFLNDLAVELNLPSLTRFMQFGASEPRSLYGNVFEALVGAMYLDRGFERTRQAIIERVLKKYVDHKLLAHMDPDYKSRLLIWCQQNKKKLEFKLAHEKQHRTHRQFEIHVYVDGAKLSEAVSTSKKDAEKEAASKALLQLGIL
ncbi:MAG: ribonuclease III [Flavobacteriales bacterium]